MAKIEKFGFYTVKADYLQFLNSRDSEVYYNTSYQTAVKPFVGIVIMVADYHYFIPLTSAKIKHIKWKNVSDDCFLIYEILKNERVLDRYICKEYSDEQKLHILSVLDTKKMIPVHENAYQKVDFNKIEDLKYRDLFRKEYAFCLKIQDKILKRAEKIYDKQKKSGIVRHAYCNFALCEKALEDWKELEQK